MPKTPTALIILDGFGLAKSTPGNAVCEANTPNLDRLFQTCPNATISASGLDVGLPDGQMGNSEVGHTNIGAGRVVFQDLPRISNAIEDGSFYENPVLRAAVQHCIDSGTSLHLMGLLSDGGVHSHTEHTWAFLELAKRMGLSRVFLHCFLDGRDVPPRSGADFVREAVKKCEKLGVGAVATVMGRYYAMDRDRRWERVEKAYAALVYGEGVTNPDPEAAVRASYDAGITDEFVVPVVCREDAAVRQNDAIIFTNFRPDRARELTRTFVDPAFSGFARQNGYFPVHYVCLTQYDADMPNVSVAFGPEELHGTFGEVVGSLGLTQLRIAETEKYAHVTFFFNGGREEPFPGEDRALIPSPKVATYDLKPEMSAYEVTGEAVARVESLKYDTIILNYANCDMVGHTGVESAAVKAVEAVDACLGRVLDALLRAGGTALVTADHGNAEQMREPDGSPFTAHTTNPVPLLLVGRDTPLRAGGRLCDLAPTMLDLMGIKKPAEMTGESLLVTA